MSTLYRSTGPNWYDIQLNYVSADGSINVTADIWETPQADELRSFFSVVTKWSGHWSLRMRRPIFASSALPRRSSTCGLLVSLPVESMIRKLIFQGLRFQLRAWPCRRRTPIWPCMGTIRKIVARMQLSFGSSPVPVTLVLPPPCRPDRIRTDRPLDAKEDTRLLLVANAAKLELRAGDVFEIDGFWLPYGSRDDADTPRRETITYGNGCTAE